HNDKDYCAKGYRFHGIPRHVSDGLTRRLMPRKLVRRFHKPTQKFIFDAKHLHVFNAAQRLAGDGKALRVSLHSVATNEPKLSPHRRIDSTKSASDNYRHQQSQDWIRYHKEKNQSQRHHPAPDGEDERPKHLVCNLLHFRQNVFAQVCSVPTEEVRVRPSQIPSEKL